jgi:hypothetical protein
MDHKRVDPADLRVRAGRGAVLGATNLMPSRPSTHQRSPIALLRSIPGSPTPPSELVDLLPWSAWSTVWIASLGARGSPSLIAWMVALGARGPPPFERMDGLPRSLGACGCALGHTDGLAPSITARLPGVVAQRVHAAAGTCITDEHKACGRQRAGATQMGATTSVCASLCQCCRGFSVEAQTSETIFGPQLFKEVDKVFKSTSWFPSYKSSV